MMDGRNLQHLDLSMHHQSMGINLCESEEALGSSESEPAKPVWPRGKRSRAAEVHNLSEKRRRSRINEKMKALQSLIPNSSKTDKASMLDDAIEYLKQLQLQVQMLSMRNGLYPVNLSGAPQPLPAFNQNSDKASNPPVVLLPVNQISGAHQAFDPTYHNQRHHKPLVLPSVPNTADPEPQFLPESSQSNLQSFPLTVSAEMIFEEDVVLKHRLSSAQDTTSVPGQQSKYFRQEAAIALSADRFDRCSLGKEQSQDMIPKYTGSLRKEQSQDMIPKYTESVLFMPHLHSSQSGVTEAGLRPGSK